MGYVKMVVIDNLSNVGINYEVANHIDNQAHIISDDHRGFSRLTDVIGSHHSEVIEPEDAMRKLPWVHTVISNCKRELLGTHHSVTRTYLQSYLNEFCYKLNRRNFDQDLFDRMLISGSKDSWY
jgi:hypothetical protein